LDSAKKAPKIVASSFMITPEAGPVSCSTNGFKVSSWKTKAKQSAWHSPTSFHILQVDQTIRAKSTKTIL
jgi:hypothetical protein